MAIDTTEETAAEFPGLGTSTGFENVKNNIADKLHTLAGKLGEKGADQDPESARAKYGKQASEWLDHSAGYVQKFDYRESCGSWESRSREFRGEPSSPVFR